VGVEELDAANGRVEDLAEPRGCEVVDIGGNHFAVLTRAACRSCARKSSSSSLATR
jgi:hypothetical protein